MAQATTQSPRPTVLALDERMDRCNGTREPLGEVVGNPIFTNAITGEAIFQITANTTKSVRNELAEISWCSPADVVRVLGINVLTETLAYPPPDVWIHGADPVSRMAQSCCALGLGRQNPGQESPQFT